MKPILLALITVTSFANAHPENATPPGKELPHAVLTGNGGWTFETVPGWGKLPDGKNLGPTHGSVLSGSDGRIYFSTDAALSVIVYEPDGRLVKTIAPECAGFHAMAIRVEGGKDVIYGAQLPKGRVCKIDTDGKILLEIPNAATGEVAGGWNGLTAVTVAPDGSIFAATGYGAQMIHKFDAAGKLLKTFGGKGSGDGQFNTCHGLAIDTRFGEPRLLVADRGNRRLVHTDLEGKFIGIHAKGLRLPCMVDIMGDFCAVAELEARVTILDKDGVPVAFLGDNPDTGQWANFGVAPGDFKEGIFTAPHGLCFDREGNLYVQDWNATGRVTKLVRK
ncbi:MAG: hypothetical protein K9N23_08565 [Akkermansiaceae bacterium]|nr:hypothetical protein [Akkermansiaceae bacterium]